MPVKMIEFILKRVGSKLDDAKAFADDIEDPRAFESIMGDLDTYLGELKNLISEFVL